MGGIKLKSKVDSCRSMSVPELLRYSRLYNVHLWCCSLSVMAHDAALLLKLDLLLDFFTDLISDPPTPTPLIQLMSTLNYNSNT